MADKGHHVVIGYCGSKEKAESVAGDVMEWDRVTDAIKLGGIGILTWENDKIKVEKVGARATGTGAKWGTILAVSTAVLTGGATLWGSALVGAAAGAATGALFHKNLGLTDQDKVRLDEHLQKGGAALVVMADDFEVAATRSVMTALGAEVENYAIPDETVEMAESAEKVEPAEA